MATFTFGGVTPTAALKQWHDASEFDAGSSDNRCRQHWCRAEPLTGREAGWLGVGVRRQREWTVGIGSTTQALALTAMVGVTGAIQAVRRRGGTRHSSATVPSAYRICASGTGDEISDIAPSRSSGSLMGVTKIAAGYDHSGALAPDGTLWLWGANAYGQLGDASFTNQRLPYQSSLECANSPSASTTLMAADSIGVVFTWGRNTASQLGDGTGLDRSTPEAISGGNYDWRGSSWCSASRRGPIQRIVLSLA